MLMIVFLHSLTIGIIYFLYYMDAKGVIIASSTWLGALNGLTFMLDSLIITGRQAYNLHGLLFESTLLGL